VLVGDLTNRSCRDAAGAESPRPGDERRRKRLTDPSFPDALVASALDTFGALDIIVNNAG
jgi:NAD(P)-dependent dehydrogenase (short-subunit alcohol dehydrogenase family)